MGNDSINKISMSIDTFKHKKSYVNEEEDREIIKIKAERKKDLMDETFISQRNKQDRINRSKQDMRGRYISPENRLGTQFRPLRVSKENLMSGPKIDEFKVRPETEKAHKRILSSGFGISKLSTNVPSKALQEFGISVRTVYGHHTPMNFSGFSGGA